MRRSTRVRKRDSDSGVIDLPRLCKLCMQYRNMYCMQFKINEIATKLPISVKLNTQLHSFVQSIARARKAGEQANISDLIMIICINCGRGRGHGRNTACGCQFDFWLYVSFLSSPVFAFPHYVDLNVADSANYHSSASP